MAWIDALFRRMIDVGASDLHLTSGEMPKFRIDGDIVDVEGSSPLSAEQMQQVLFEIAPERNQVQFTEENDTDFAYALPGVARFRSNFFRDNTGPGAVFRQIPSEILTAEQLGLPQAVVDLCYLSKGLVVVTGPTGSGKSTTLAAMVDLINKSRSDHIITIEDPIEFVHRNKRCLINQREVHQHTQGFKRALRAALREDPDIVLVGEMRDLETIEIAIETAETGHLVFGTLHTTTATSTVDRIIDQFPADRQAQIRTMLSSSLKGVIAQTLCKKQPKGRVAALEILISNTAVSSNIRDGKTHQLQSAMQMGGKLGMRLLNDSLQELVQSGLVDADEAYLKSVDKEDMQTRLARIGATTTKRTVDGGAGAHGGAHGGAGAHGAGLAARPAAPRAHAPAPAAHHQPAQPTHSPYGNVAPDPAAAVPHQSPYGNVPAQPAQHAPLAAPGHAAPRGPLPTRPAREEPAEDASGSNPFDRFKRNRGR